MTLRHVLSYQGYGKHFMAKQMRLANTKGVTKINGVGTIPTPTHITLGGGITLILGGDKRVLQTLNLSNNLHPHSRHNHNHYKAHLLHIPHHKCHNPTTLNRPNISPRTGGILKIIKPGVIFEHLRIGSLDWNRQSKTCTKC